MGIASRDYGKILVRLTREIEMNARIYTDLRQYIKDNTLFTNLGINYFKNLFHFKMMLDLFVFFVFFIAHLNSKKIIEQSIKLFYFCQKVLNFIRNQLKKLINCLKHYVR